MVLRGVTLLSCGLLLAGLAGCSSTRAYFSPESDLPSVFTSEVQAAQSTVHVAIYTFTLGTLRDALFDAAAMRGVQVQVCADAGQTFTLSDQLDALRILRDDAGAEVATVDGFGGGIMHHKFAVIDSHTVLTGSFNYTRSASEINDENLVVIADPALAAHYEGAFGDLWSRCEPL